jgi:hypothetical protein
MRQARACFWAYKVLPATRTLIPIRKDSSPITTQSSPAVTHCILAAPQFTYPEGMEGWVYLSAPGIEPGPHCVVSAVGGRSTDWANQTDILSYSKSHSQRLFIISPPLISKVALLKVSEFGVGFSAYFLHIPFWMAPQLSLSQQSIIFWLHHLGCCKWQTQLKSYHAYVACKLWYGTQITLSLCSVAVSWDWCHLQNHVSQLLWNDP